MQNDNNVILDIIAAKYNAGTAVGGFAYAEGAFHLFLSRRSGIYWRLEHYISQDAIRWSKAKDIVKSIFKIGAGSAIMRGEKIYLTYKYGHFGGCHMAISKNAWDFDAVELPIFKDKLLVKRYVTPRILFSNNEYYILASNRAKFGEIGVFSSQGGVNWEHKFDFNVGFKNKYLSLFSLEGICFLLCEKNDGTVWFSRVQVDLGQKKIFFVGEWSRLYGVSRPRTAVLQDGRVIMWGAIDRKRKTMLTTPRELFCCSDTIACRPMRELYFKRDTEVVAEIVDSQDIAVEAKCGLDIEINPQEHTNSIQIKVNYESTFYGIEISKTGIVTDAERIEFDSEIIEAIRLVVMGSKVEVYANSGKCTASILLDRDCSGVSITGKAQISYYKMNI